MHVNTLIRTKAALFKPSISIEFCYVWCYFAYFFPGCSINYGNKPVISSLPAGTLAGIFDYNVA